MTNVLVVYASRHGGTRGIAERIAATLTDAGIQARATSAETARDVAVADAYVIGSGVYMGSWLKEGTDFISHYAETLATRPVWLFSSGPLKGSTAKTEGLSAEEAALGPLDGPGSGGRKKVAELSALIHARENRVFFGAYNPADPPKAIAERFVRLMPASKGLLPPGDYREWDVIDAWARVIARELREKVPVA
jgi:menaquinone-dependent protoporphyrinogen oxidase